MVNRNLVTLGKKIINKIDNKFNLMEDSDTVLMQHENDYMLFSESIYLIDEEFL